jgi:hypothetical protein
VCTAQIFFANPAQVNKKNEWLGKVARAKCRRLCRRQGMIQGQLVFDLKFVDFPFLPLPGQC